jgi:hypothetical protein
MQKWKVYLDPLDAHQIHTSSSDSCSRSSFFRSPTSEGQSLLSLHLTNLRKKKILSGYMICKIKKKKGTICIYNQQSPGYLCKQGKQSKEENHFYVCGDS